jgi:hypothetical protein
MSFAPAESDSMASWWWGKIGRKILENLGRDRLALIPDVRDH